VADEVERKFRVRQVPPSLGEGTRLRQAYLALDGNVEVRVRDQGGTPVLGVKGGRGLQRTEVEVEIGPAEFDELWALAPDRRIAKTRHRIDVGGHVAEVDVYTGPLEGLVMVEVEFASRDEAEAFDPPPWFGDDVTDDGRWSNAALATSGPPPP
jgi:CYTH domain-containing protein